MRLRNVTRTQAEAAIRQARRIEGRRDGDRSILRSFERDGEGS